MTRATVAGGVLAAALVLAALAAVCRDRLPGDDHAGATTAAVPEATAEPAPEAQQGFLYGRITADDGAYEGRLRWGRTEEAFWGDYFNGRRDGNAWAAHVPADQLKERHPIEIFGIAIPGWARQIELARPFMARFGDLARIEPLGRIIRVTLKSGTGVSLDRFAADDLADGVRVWDRRGVVDLTENRIRLIEFRPTAAIEAAPERLHGTVVTRHGEFTGFVQWNREGSVGADEIAGRVPDGAEIRLRFDAVRAIARHAREGVLVTLAGGREVALSGSRDAGRGHRGLFVDDPRYGRVLVPWDAFERVDFGPAGRAGSGPAFADFPPGRPLAGRVTTRDGREIAGRLVYDLDESETTETLDASWDGVDYTIPFGLVAAIVPPGRDERARVILRSGEELPLERTGDLGDGNAGLLVFVGGRDRPEYVRWSDVERIDFDPPPAGDPPADRPASATPSFDLLRFPVHHPTGATGGRSGAHDARGRPLDP